MSGTGKEVAELVEKDLKVKAAKGEYLGIVEERKIRFEVFVKEYLEWSQANKAKRTYTLGRNVSKSQLIPFFQGKFLGGITTKDVENYKVLRARTLQPQSVNRELGVLRTMLSKAVDWRYLRRNPATGVKELKAQKRPLNIYSLRFLQADDHLFAFLQASGLCRV